MRNVGTWFSGGNDCVRLMVGRDLEGLLQPIQFYEKNWGEKTSLEEAGILPTKCGCSQFSSVGLFGRQDQSWIPWGFLQHIQDLHPESYIFCDVKVPDMRIRFQIQESEPFFARREVGDLPAMGSVHVNALKG